MGALVRPQYMKHENKHTGWAPAEKKIDTENVDRQTDTHARTHMHTQDTRAHTHTQHIRCVGAGDFVPYIMTGAGGETRCSSCPDAAREERYSQLALTRGAMWGTVVQMM